MDMTVGASKVVITGLDKKDQFIDIAAPCPVRCGRRSRS